MKDRLSKYPGRVKLTPVAGQADTFDMIRADEPENEGTPLNKNSLLKDETAEKLGLEPESATPDRAFDAVNEKFSPKVGDIIETVRADIGDNWVLCNGDILPEGELPALREKLFYNTEWMTVTIQADDYDEVRPTRRPGEWLFISFGNSLALRESAKVYNAITETWTTIDCPAVTTDYSYGIFGLAWDGERYVLGVAEDSSSAAYTGSVTLFVSTDLENWTKKYNFKTQGNSYQAVDMTSDGENTIVMERYVNYGATSTTVGVYISAVNKAMNKKTKLHSTSSEWSGQRLIPAPDGYWGLNYPIDNSGDPYDRVLLYKAGETSALMYSREKREDSIVFFSDKYVLTGCGVLTESEGTYGPYNTVITDLTTGTSTSRQWQYVLGFGDTLYLQGCEYYRTEREWVFYFKQIGAKYWAAYISEDADPLVGGNYRIEQIVALPENLYTDQMSPDRAVWHEIQLRDPNLKYLPTADGETYKYIYKGADEA